MLIITDSMHCAYTLGFSQRDANKTTKQFQENYFEDEKEVLKKKRLFMFEGKIAFLKKCLKLH